MVAHHEIMLLLHGAEIGRDELVLLHAGVEDDDVGHLETFVFRLVSLHATEMHARLHPFRRKERLTTIGRGDGDIRGLDRLVRCRRDRDRHIERA